MLSSSTRRWCVHRLTLRHNLRRERVDHNDTSRSTGRIHPALDGLRVSRLQKRDNGYGDDGDDDDIVDDDDVNVVDDVFALGYSPEI